MESNDKLKEINIKNCACYYFDSIIKLKDFDIDNVLVGEKSFKNILVYDISHKTLMGAKPLHIRFDKIDGFIRVYDETRYLVLFGAEKYDFIYNRIRYLIGVTSGVIYTFFNDYARFKVDSYDSLPVKH